MESPARLRPHKRIYGVLPKNERRRELVKAKNGDTIKVYNTGALEIWLIPSLYVSSRGKHVLASPIQSSALVTVPPGRELLRTSLMKTHTEKQLDEVLDVFKRTGKQVGGI